MLLLLDNIIFNLSVENYSCFSKESYYILI